MFPHASVAVHVRVRVNASGHEPAMVASTNVSVGVEQLSVAVGFPHTGVPEHSIVLVAGIPEITGGVVSSTFMI